MRSSYSLIFLLFSSFLFSQTKTGTYKDFFMEGSYLLLENNADKARQNFIQAYKLDSSSANINYLLGVCYLQSTLEKSRAEYYLEKAVKNVSKTYRPDESAERAAAPLAIFYYGEALHINYQFDEAIAQFEAFRKYVDPKDKEYQKMVNKDIATSKLAKDMVNHPINAQITNMGDSINSIYPEYSPVFSADERMLIFTTRRPNTTGGLKTDDDKYFEDIVVSYKDDLARWSKPVSISTNVNTINHEGSINLSPDGQTLIVFKNDAGGKNPDEGNGNIYYSTYDAKDWSNLLDFGSDVNSEYWESHACLNADGTVLFFASERPGGIGGKDIYRCIKLPNGKWSKALNMGPNINSEFDEDGGFIHPDGQTFFFSSNGNNSMGGFDIMFATLNEENKFSNATNIGYPINTTDDDIFYVTSPDGKRGYFSSAKAEGFGDKDIYKITIAESKEPFLALFKGQLIPAEGEKLPENLLIVVTDKQSNEIIGTYRPKMVNGTFSTILPPGKEYNFSYQTDEGEEFYNEDVFVGNDVVYQEIKREVNLEPVKLSGKVKVKQKTIILNAIVLNNNKHKKPVPGAKLVLEEEGGVKQFFDVNESGRYDGIILQPEKKYKIYTEINGKKSSVAEISTIGAKSAKIISQVIYVEGKSEKFTSKELLLNITVKNTLTRKPVPNANIKLTDADGEYSEAITDANGVIKGIELSPDTRYEVMAYKDGSVSEKESFITGTVAEGKGFEKTLFIAWEDSAALAKHNKKGAKYQYPVESTFEFYYKYGRKVINEQDPKWLRFITYVTEQANTKKLVQVYLRSSASKVPTRLKGGNKKLAAIRGKKFETLVKEALLAKGVDMKKIKFIRSSGVFGPKYRGDWKVGRTKYEKYQYLKAKCR